MKNILKECIYLTSEWNTKDSPEGYLYPFARSGDWHSFFTNIVEESMDIDEYIRNEETRPFIWKVSVFNRQDWFKFVRMLDHRLIKLLQNGKGLLVFINPLEGQPLIVNNCDDNFLPDVYYEFQQLGIPTKNVVYMTANSMATESHIKWMNENAIEYNIGHDGYINIIGFFPAALTYRRLLTNNFLENNTFDQHFKKILDNKDSLKHFIKLHRSDRIYRSAITQYLWKNGLLDTLLTTHVSYAIDEMGVPPNSSNHDGRIWWNSLVSTRSEFEKILPIEADITCKDNIKKYTPNAFFTSDVYYNSLFNIATASWPYQKNTAFLREGLFNHIWNYQPYIAYSNVNSLIALKERGYETFDNIFDESYDTEHDDVVRLKKVCESIEKISRLSIDDAIDCYVKSKDKVIHNRHIMQDRKEEDRIIKLFNKSIDALYS